MRARERKLSSASLPICASMGRVGLGHSLEARDSIKVSHMEGRQESNHLNHYMLPSRCISARNLESGVRAKC